MIRGWRKYLELSARFVVWLCAVIFALLTVLGVIPILPEPTSIMLVGLLYLFMVAALITWYFDIERLRKDN